MRPVDPFEFPPEQEEAFRKARRLEWWSIAYIASATALLGLTMSTSQAMRTSFFDNAISLLPPIAFLIGSAVARRKPGHRFPYGFHRAVSIGYLAAAMALLAMGAFLLIEAATTLLSGDRASIGGVTLFDQTVWAGWLMLPALFYAAVPCVLLGRAKLKLAPKIHDKVLFADAEMNKANWLGEGAAAFGVIGIGLGFWWADGLGAAIVSLDILWDGMKNIYAAVTALLNITPKKTDDPSKVDEIPEAFLKHIEEQPWVESAELRMREDGHVFFGEAFVVPRVRENLVENIADLSNHAKDFNWRIHQVVVTPVTSDSLKKK